MSRWVHLTKSEDQKITLLDLAKAYRIEHAPSGEGTVILFLGASPVGVDNSLGEIAKLLLE